jgi:hypothetical protein
MLGASVDKLLTVGIPVRNTEDGEDGEDLEDLPPQAAGAPASVGPGARLLSRGRLFSITCPSLCIRALYRYAHSHNGVVGNSFVYITCRYASSLRVMVLLKMETIFQHRYCSNARRVTNG